MGRGSRAPKIFDDPYREEPNGVVTHGGEARFRCQPRHCILHRRVARRAVCQRKQFPAEMLQRTVEVYKALS